jgi:PEGA domain
MRARGTLLITAVLGAQMCWAVGSVAQTVEPVQAPSPPKKAQPPTDTQPASPNQGETPSRNPSVRKPPDKAALEGAKRAYSAGEKAYKAGDYKNAIQNFRDAQAVLPTPQAGYWLALSLKADGQVPEALAELKTLLASPSSERLGSEKLAMAKATLEELNKTPGTIALSTEPAGATVSVDGEVRPGVSPLSVELPPGAHTLTISMPGYQSMELELEVPPGSKGEQKLSLTPLPPPPPAPAGAPAAPASQAQHVVIHATGEVAPKTSNVGKYVVFGMAGAGAVVGTIFGLRALGEKADFDKTPSEAIADKIERDSMIADIGFGAAITLGLAGLVMATVTEGLPAGREKAGTGRSPVRPALSFSPTWDRRGGGASAVWQF